MEITTLLGKFLQSISKNIYDDSEQSKELIEQLTQIANIYNSGKNNTELINSLKSITKEFGEDDKELKENDREEGKEKEEEALKESQPESQERTLEELQPENQEEALKEPQPENQERALEEPQPESQERELEEPQPEFQERTLEGKREEDNEEEKIDLKPFDWKAFVYEIDNEGLFTRYYNDINGCYIGGYGNDDEIAKIGTDLTWNRDVVRDSSNLQKFQILLTTQKLGKVRGKGDRGGSTSCFTISVTEEELARLKLSEDMELKLENGKDLVNTLDSIVHSNDPKDDRTIRNQKVLIPFTNKKLEVSSIDIEMAKTIIKVLRFLETPSIANSKYFNIQFDGNSLDMEQTIKIANIFSKLPIKFKIRHANGRGNYHAEEHGTWIIGSPEITNKGKDILTLDVKDGLATEKNIAELERFLREDSLVSRICERANVYIRRIDYWKNAKRKDGLPLTDEDKEYVQSKIKEAEEELKKEIDYEKIQSVDQEIQKLYEKLKPTQNKDTQSLKKMSGMALREGISRQDTDMAKQQEHEHEHKKDGAEYE